MFQLLLSVDACLQLHDWNVFPFTLSLLQHLNQNKYAWISFTFYKAAVLYLCEWEQKDLQNVFQEISLNNHNIVLKY